MIDFSDKRLIFYSEVINFFYFPIPVYLIYIKDCTLYLNNHLLMLNY